MSWTLVGYHCFFIYYFQRLAINRITNSYPNSLNLEEGDYNFMADSIISSFHYTSMAWIKRYQINEY